jgi:N utilization substance protein B
LAQALEKQVKQIRLAEPYARELVEGVLSDKSKIDRKISQYAPEFPVQQLSAIDRNVLRVAIWETLFNNGTPSKVVINEAVEIAKAFGTEASSRFINGVLGSLLEEKSQ